MAAITNTDRIRVLEAATIRHSAEIENLKEKHHLETSILREDLRQTIKDLSIANERIAALE